MYGVYTIVHVHTHTHTHTHTIGIPETFCDAVTQTLHNWPPFRFSFPFVVNWRCRQQVPLKQCWIYTRLHGNTFQET